MYIFLTNIWKHGKVVPFIHEVWSTGIFEPGTIIYLYVLYIQYEVLTLVMEEVLLSKVVTIQYKNTPLQVKRLHFKFVKIQKYCE